jgi:hypothetical protein
MSVYGEGLYINGNGEKVCDVRRPAKGWNKTARMPAAPGSAFV